MPGKDDEETTVQRLLALPLAAPTCLCRLLNTAKTTTATTTIPTMPAPPEESRGAPEVVVMVDSNEAAEPATALVQQGDGGAATDSSLVPYVQLVRAFCAVRRDQLETLVQQQQQQWQADGNLEWVRLCQAALLRRRLYQIASIYSVISWSKLAQLLELPATQEQVQSLLWQVSAQHAWAIRMSNDSDDNDIDSIMVEFPPRPTTHQTEDHHHNASRTLAVVEDDDITFHNVAQLAQLMRHLDVQIATSSKYASAQQRQARSSKAAPRGPRGVEDV